MSANDSGETSPTIGSSRDLSGPFEEPVTELQTDSSQDPQPKSESIEVSAIKSLKEPAVEAADRVTVEAIMAPPAPEIPSRHRSRLESQKLNRTLQELESAFSDWEDLSAAKPVGAPVPEKVTEREQEFKSRTKKLLSDLREQLEDL